ncbi:hypothetical protein J4465_01010 [Candidatus Pacearchaeota archaeon]|nr:hypothetical protein [Candidatus Pacearchaeota archaeon]
MQKRRYGKEESKQKTYLTLAMALSVAAILFLIINSVYLEVNKQRFVSELKLNPNISLQTIHTIPILVDLVVVIWIALALILAFSLFFLKGTKCLWVVLLIVSIISLITFRIDSFIMGILASIFYSKTLKFRY